MNMGNDSNGCFPKLHDHTTLYGKEINILRSSDAKNAGCYMFGIFDLDDCKKVQLAAWLMKDEALFWWEVTNGERVVETWANFRGRFELKFLSQAQESMYMERFLTLKQKKLDREGVCDRI